MSILLLRRDDSGLVLSLLGFFKDSRRVRITSCKKLWSDSLSPSGPINGCNTSSRFFWRISSYSIRVGVNVDIQDVKLEISVETKGCVAKYTLCIANCYFFMYF